MGSAASATCRLERFAPQPTRLGKPVEQFFGSFGVKRLGESVAANIHDADFCGTVGLEPLQNTAGIYMFWRKPDLP